MMHTPVWPIHNTVFELMLFISQNLAVYCLCIAGPSILLY